MESLHQLASFNMELQSKHSTASSSRQTTNLTRADRRLKRVLAPRISSVSSVDSAIEVKSRYSDAACGKVVSNSEDSHNKGTKNKTIDNSGRNTVENNDINRDSVPPDRNEIYNGKRDADLSGEQRIKSKQIFTGDIDSSTKLISSGSNDVKNENIIFATNFPITDQDSNLVNNVGEKSSSIRNDNFIANWDSIGEDQESKDSFFDSHLSDEGLLNVPFLNQSYTSSSSCDNDCLLENSEREIHLSGEAKKNVEQEMNKFEVSTKESYDAMPIVCTKGTSHATLELCALSESSSTVTSLSDDYTILKDEVITGPQPFQSTSSIEQPIESDMEKSAATTIIDLQKVEGCVSLAKQTPQPPSKLTNNQVQIQKATYPSCVSPLSKLSSVSLKSVLQQDQLCQKNLSPTSLQVSPPSMPLKNQTVSYQENHPSSLQNVTNQIDEKQQNETIPQSQNQPKKNQQAVLALKSEIEQAGEKISQTPSVLYSSSCNDHGKQEQTNTETIAVSASKFCQHDQEKCDTRSNDVNQGDHDVKPMKSKIENNTSYITEGAYDIRSILEVPPPSFEFKQKSDITLSPKLGFSNTYEVKELLTKLDMDDTVRKFDPLIIPDALFPGLNKNHKVENFYNGETVTDQMKFSLAPVGISNVQDEGEYNSNSVREKDKHKSVKSNSSEAKNVLDLVPVEELPVPLQKRECLEDINNLLPNLMMSSSCDTGEDVEKKESQLHSSNHNERPKLSQRQRIEHYISQSRSMSDSSASTQTEQSADEIDSDDNIDLFQYQGAFESLKDNEEMNYVDTKDIANGTSIQNMMNNVKIKANSLKSQEDLGDNACFLFCRAGKQIDFLADNIDSKIDTTENVKECTSEMEAISFLQQSPTSENDECNTTVAELSLMKQISTNEINTIPDKCEEDQHIPFNHTLSIDNIKTMDSELSENVANTDNNNIIEIEKVDIDSIIVDQRSLTRESKDSKSSIPLLKPIPPGKLKSWLSSTQPNVVVQDKNDETYDRKDGMNVENLDKLAEIRKQVSKYKSVIENVIPSNTDSNDDVTSNDVKMTEKIAMVSSFAERNFQRQFSRKSNEPHEDEPESDHKSHKNIMGKAVAFFKPKRVNKFLNENKTNQNNELSTGGGGAFTPWGKDKFASNAKYYKTEGQVNCFDNSSISDKDIVLTETLLFWIVNSILIPYAIKAGEDCHKTIPLLFQSMKPFNNQTGEDIIQFLRELLDNDKIFNLICDHVVDCLNKNKATKQHHCINVTNDQEETEDFEAESIISFGSLNTSNLQDRSAQHLNRQNKLEYFVLLSDLDKPSSNILAASFVSFLHKVSLISGVESPIKSNPYLDAMITASAKNLSSSSSIDGATPSMQSVVFANDDHKILLQTVNFLHEVSRLYSKMTVNTKSTTIVNNQCTDLPSIKVESLITEVRSFLTPYKSLNLNLVVPGTSPSPFEIAIWNRPSILVICLMILGDPVIVCKMKNVNKFCSRIINENEHELILHSVRIGGLHKHQRPAFWLWITLGKWGREICMYGKEEEEEDDVILNKNDSGTSPCLSIDMLLDFPKLEKVGREGKWNHMIQRDVARAFGNMPPHKTEGRAKDNSIVHALVSWREENCVEPKNNEAPIRRLTMSPTSKDEETEMHLMKNDLSINQSDTNSDRNDISHVSNVNTGNQSPCRQTSINVEASDDFALGGIGLSGDMKIELQNKLGFVLHAIAAAHERIGYCQGMDYVVAHLLRILPDTIDLMADSNTLLSGTSYSRKCSSCNLVVEETVFRVMHTFLTTYNLRHLYWPELRCLKTLCRVFERLIQQKLPVLADHFDHHELNVGLFSLGWFQTLFLYIPSMPSATINHMWDIWLVERSMKIFFRVGTAILFLSQPILLNHELEGMMTYLNTFPDSTLLNPDILIPCALQIKVTNKLLAEIEMDVVRENELGHGNNPNDVFF